MPPSALAGPPPQDAWLGSIRGQRATSSKKQRVQGGGFTRRGAQALPARPRLLPSSQPGQPPSHAMLSFSASDAPRGAPRFFHQKSQKQNEKQIRAEASGPDPLPTPVVNGGRRRRDPSPVPDPIRCQDPRGRRLRARGTSAASPSLWGGKWGELACGSPPTVGEERSEEAPPQRLILCLQAGAALSAKKERAWIPRSNCSQSPWLQRCDLWGPSIHRPPPPVAPQNLPPDGDFFHRKSFPPLALLFPPGMPVFLAPLILGPPCRDLISSHPPKQKQQPPSWW